MPAYLQLGEFYGGPLAIAYTGKPLVRYSGSGSGCRFGRWAWDPVAKVVPSKCPVTFMPLDPTPT